MDVLFVIPRYSDKTKPYYDYAFPISLAYISASLKEAGHNVDCLNTNHLEGKTKDLVKNALDKKRYDVLCTGHTGIGCAVTQEIINVTREHQTSPKVILGGHIVTHETKLMFEEIDPDFAVVGEGEDAVLELLDYIKKYGPQKNDKVLENIRGICYRGKDGSIKITLKRDPIKDIDALPQPDFEGFGFEEKINHMHPTANYSTNSFDHPKAYPLVTARSCPYPCTFCYYSVVKGKYTVRSLDNVFNELRTNIKKYKINVIEIYDDLFAVDNKRLKEFCERMIELKKEIPWDVKWTCQIRVKAVDRETLELMKKAGCDVISYGFESYSEKILDSMKKFNKPEDIDRTFKETMRVQIGIQGNFIFGDLAETPETAKETLDYWIKESKGQINLFLVQPYPGSAIYESCVKKGIIKDRLDFIKNQIKYFDINMTDSMSDEEFDKLKKDLVKYQEKGYKFVIPSMKKSGEDEYDLTVKCPFCEEQITYGNCLIENKNNFRFPLLCRNCKMKFWARSWYKALGYKFYNVARPLYHTYSKLKKSFSQVDVETPTLKKQRESISKI